MVLLPLEGKSWFQIGIISDADRPASGCCEASIHRRADQHATAVSRLEATASLNRSSGPKDAARL
jgi:hypothetical protein